MKKENASGENAACRQYSRPLGTTEQGDNHEKRLVMGP